MSSQFRTLYEMKRISSDVVEGVVGCFLGEAGGEGEEEMGSNVELQSGV